MLLFELLEVLNQSPFSSKGVTDLAQAVREGKFAYRFVPKDNSGTVSDGSDTPDGPYRMIWGNIRLMPSGKAFTIPLPGPRLPRPPTGAMPCKTMSMTS